jgi:hypothetical protein
MKAVLVNVAVAIAAFALAWTTYPRFHATENTDAVAGVTVSAFYDALDRLHPNAKPLPAPDQLNVALTLCDFRHTMTPQIRELASRDECAVRVMGWTKYYYESVRAKRTGAAVAKPPEELQAR